MEWDYLDMDSAIRVPVTAAIFFAATILLTGCIAYDAVSTAASVGGAVVRTGASAVSTAGDVVTYPLRHGDSEKPK